MMTRETIVAVRGSREKRREERRGFFKKAAAAAIAAPVVLTMGGKPLNAQTAVSDADILNFALNLEYLEAQFYVYAVTGAGLPANLLTGTGTQGPVRPGRAVNFTDPLVREYAHEIAADETAHVIFLRNALGTARVAQPAIDVSAEADGAFSAAARAAGLVGPGQAFDPYLNDENFLLGAFIFEDVGVTAYKGASPLITNKTFLEAAAGILAVEAYHAGLIRTVLFRKGIQNPALQLIESTEKISLARDSLDGTSDKDQGIAPIGNASNIAPLDANGLAYSRSAGEVLNIVYLTSMARNQGGFFPAGVNGNIRTSAAN
jgi:hypothetical protein